MEWKKWKKKTQKIRHEIDKLFFCLLFLRLFRGLDVFFYYFLRVFVFIAFFFLFYFYLCFDLLLRFLTFWMFFFVNVCNSIEKLVSIFVTIHSFSQSHKKNKWIDVYVCVCESMSFFSQYFNATHVNYMYNKTLLCLFWQVHLFFEITQLVHIFNI